MILRAAVQGMVKPIHVRLRMQKIRLFSRALCPSPEDTLLDIGGGFGIADEFKELYSRFSRVVVLNLEQSETATMSSTRVERINADGCLLPFEDRSFDWIFSNAVIEHVGGLARQQHFANEVRRVFRKGYFVTTPNRYFPIDPHALLPLISVFVACMAAPNRAILPRLLTRMGGN